MPLDWNFVTQRLAVGGTVADPAAVRTLTKHGVTHVLSCESERDGAALFAGSRVKYLRLPLPDDGKPRPAEWFASGIAFGLPALAVADTRLYVHCAMGRQRGPSMAYAILRAFGLTPALALRLLEDGRPYCRGCVGYRADADRALRELGFEAANESYLPSCR